MAACLRHAQSLSDPPDVIFNGGDMIMDALHADAGRTRLLWDLWRKILKDECSLPVVHCIGNHDVWGWDKSKSGATGREPLYGKNWVMDVLGLDRRYWSFDQAGWHFIVLDSTHTHDSQTYTAKLDDEQWEWLRTDLAGTPPGTPICVMSHIPVLSACAYFDGDNEKGGDWCVPNAWMHIDARRIKDLFTEHPNVRLCLSGHIHLLDRVDYNGVTYLCNGAVSGNWWKGVYDRTPPGYAVVDLYDDGSFTHMYLTFGWRDERSA
ncbi:MAG: hypothetical protein Kow0059_03810 [Candidatus Sumerlaeia bacterium]